MTTVNFEFAQFANFTRRENFDVLMREFQTTQAHADEAVKVRDQAKLEFYQWQEYLDLVTDYRDLFSSMMKKLLDAKTGDEIEKARTVFNNKLVPVLQKLDLIQKKIDGLLPAATAASRNVIEDKMNQVKQMLESVTKLKSNIMDAAPARAPDEVLLAPV